MTAPTPEQVTVLLRPCPTCGAAPAELCRRVESGRTHHLRLGRVHKARLEPTAAERREARRKPRR